MSTAAEEAFDFACEPFEALLDDFDRIHAVVTLSVEGIGSAPAMVELVDALHGATAPERVDHAKERAARAQLEIDRGFSTVYELGTVAGWAALEAALTDFIARWIQAYPPIRRSLGLGDLKIRLVEFESAGPEDRAWLVLDELQRRTSSRLKPGIGRFEALLSEVGLGGSVDSEVRRNLLEMSEMRNVLLHRGGVVDARLLERCPWLKLPTDERIEVAYSDFGRYMGAAGGYAATVVRRKKSRVPEIEVAESAALPDQGDADKSGSKKS